MSLIGIDYRTQYEAAEERIRELEDRERKRELEMDTLLSRIAKAREILEVVQLDSENSWARIKAKEALAALEGK